MEGKTSTAHHAGSGGYERKGRSQTGGVVPLPSEKKNRSWRTRPDAFLGGVGRGDSAAASAGTQESKLQADSAA